MRLTAIWKSGKVYIILLVGLIVLSVVGWRSMGQQSFVRTALSGLTLGALYFMVAAGLTIIFGLMDVLNFAHGAMFMIGAYAGWQFYTNPTFLFGLAPLVLALVAGIVVTPLIQPLAIRWAVPVRWQRTLRTATIIIAIVLVVVGLLGLDVRGLAKTAMVATMVDPLAEATPQEPLAAFWRRPALFLLAGLLIALAQARPGDRTQVVRRSAARRSIAALLGFALLTAVATLTRESAAIAVLKMNADVRFFLSLAAGALIGAAIGGAIEISLVRPLYVRPTFLILATMGLSFVLRELTQLLWDPLPYAMSRPPLFSQPGKAASILEWFSKHTLTVEIMGVTFPSYRLFIIALGLAMFVLLMIVMNYSRLGMTIRAGVQDRDMVEALGINVRRVFTLVFALGAGLAALGGIGAAPFAPVEPVMGDRFQMQGFITVVIGGMGSYSGAAIGALLLGLARAFGDFLALKFSLTPAVSEASTVIIMALVLLLRPAGLFGKKE
ncbi:MAG: branched-chain amino acid ABC transporter permease [Chloroflexi bacterium]|nr:branched-chain amino acid ABC transporter permease [Chloroflexota bacterium]